MPKYKIKDWDAEFARGDLQRTGAWSYVGVPIRHDGKSYRRLARHADAVDVFCAWSLLIQVAAKMPVKGVLADHDGPLDADDIADATGYPKEIFEKAFHVLTDKSLKILWLEEVTDESASTVPGRTRTHPSESVLRRGEEIRVEEKREEKTLSVAAKASPSGKAKASGANGSIHQSCIEFFSQRWESKYGQPYPFKAGRDGKHIKWLRSQVKEDLSKFKAIIETYLSDEDEFVSERRHSIGQLVSGFEKYIVPKVRTQTDPLGPGRAPTADEIAIFVAAGEDGAT